MDATRRSTVRIFFAISCDLRTVHLSAEAIKQWGDVNKGVATQGLLFTTISKAVKQGRVNQDTVFNLLLKINVKMGGANWKFSPVM